MHIQDKQEQDRLKQLLTAIPDIENYLTCIYIGASPNRFEIARYLFGQYFIYLIEAHPPNAKYWADKVDYSIFNKVSCNDVVTYHDQSLIDNPYDIVMWWHGPEHIPKNDVFPTLEKLSKWASKYIIIACPYGEYIQGPYQGNPYEEHKCHLYPNDFLSHGFEVSTLGEIDTRGSNLIAWKRNF